MRKPRIYIDEKLETGLSVELPKDAARHLIKVLRLRIGDGIILFNGKGGCEYPATITQSADSKLNALPQEAVKKDTSPSLCIHLGLCVSKGERMDYAIQKAVELGVSKITPLLSQRTVVKLNGERKKRRSKHWQSVIIAACEQSGRVDIPKLYAPQSLSDWLDDGKPSNTLMLHPVGNKPLHSVKVKQQELGLLIGPEGGFDDKEIKKAMKNDCTAIQLGPRVLRTETAPVAAIAAIQALWGDFR